MSFELDNLEQPFLEDQNKNAEPHDTFHDLEGPDFIKLASLPVSEKYTVEFRGEEIVVDSANWRDSNLLKLQIIASYCNFILFGLAEQTLGTLIPELQAHYKINDLKTGYVFLASVSGYFSMALLTEVCHRRLGVRGVVIMGTTSMTLGYLVLSTRPPFFVFILCYVLSGLGFGSLDAGLNGWMGNLVDLNQLLGILHGCYGIGCMISPPLITHLVDRDVNPWSWNSYYLVLSCVAASCLLFFALVFRRETPAKYEFSVILKETRRQLEDKNASDDETTSESDSSSQAASLSQSLRSKLVWFFSIIMFVYVGAEVAFGAWMVTFLLRVKNLTYKMSSYMATTFWTGLTAGRICLGFVTAHYFSSELSANWVYIVVSLVGYGVFCMFAYTSAVGILFPVVFLTGLFVGPIFPTTIVAAIEILPVKYHASGVGFICAFGGGGGAAIPFLIGLVAQTSERGLKFYPFIIIILFKLLLVAWLLLCVKFRTHKRRSAL
ncbi:CIC11C00000006002 [Sungouiella intermedia]|uniref:CIC11C00000006002 n=1 Tax=Sungouiella intermedia TaxID=45354 RepID=A0A1L0BKS5_9ASCO|nr:CIC11C00000006002 [[Candida] intermedia]